MYAIHVTSPFPKDKTLIKALKIFSKKNKKFDSVVTITNVKEYLWKKNKAINYKSSNKHPRSQDLKGVIALNFAVNIVSTKFMRQRGRITSDNFYPIGIKFPRKY